MLRNLLLKMAKSVFAIFVLMTVIYNIILFQDVRAAAPGSYYKYKCGIGCNGVCENIVFVGDNPKWYNCIDPNDTFDCSYMKCTCVDNLPRN